MTSSLAAGRIVSKRCELAEKDVNKEEKKLLAPVDFMVLDTGALRGFSEPEEYTHRITSASMCSAIQLKMSVARSIEQGEDLRVDLTLLTDMNPKGLKFWSPAGMSNSLDIPDDFANLTNLLSLK